MTERIQLSLASGEAIQVARYTEKELEIVSPKPFAPGSPIRLNGSLAGENIAIEGRALGSKRRDDSTFSVRLRFVSLTRRDRELLRGLG